MLMHIEIINYKLILNDEKLSIELLKASNGQLKSCMGIKS
jgi:hypothetical protein